MSRYTLHGSDALDARIDRDLERVRERIQPLAEVGILMGGYGRGEGTPFIRPDGTEEPFNDYDLVVITERLSKDERTIFRRLEAELTDELGICVDLCPYPKSSLPRREFSLLNAELKHGHQIVWGDAGILDALPDYPLDQIPKTEGSRLLLNRGKLLLDLCERFTDVSPLSDAEILRAVKFLHKVRLATGDAALLDADQYALSYVDRINHIETIGDCPDREAVIEDYRRAVAFRNRAEMPDAEDLNIPDELKVLRNRFLAFFNWYRRRHPGRECSLFKAMLLNLCWNGRPLMRHPRFYLYTALNELLQDALNPEALSQCLFSPADPVARFRLLQQRFS